MIGLLMDNLLRKALKEAVEALFVVISRRFCGGTEEIYKQPRQDNR
jgi:hypothetical protein